MLLFRSEEALDQWCAKKGLARGAVFAPDQIWALARFWYADRMAPDFRGRTLEEAYAIFEQVGLSGDFWLWPD